MSRAAKTGSVAETLQKALRLHQAGQLDKAARLYGTVLKKNPDNGDALNLKGVVAQAHGRHDDALALFGRAITALPDFADVHFNKANTLKALGRNDDALAAYAKAIALKPDYADARLNAGTLLQKTGRTTEAIAAFREMARFSPADPRGHYSLGVCLTEALPAAKSEEREAMTEEADAPLYAPSLSTPTTQTPTSLTPTFTQNKATTTAPSNATKPSSISNQTGPRPGAIWAVIWKLAATRQRRKPHLTTR